MGVLDLALLAELASPELHRLGQQTLVVLLLLQRLVVVAEVELLFPRHSLVLEEATPVVVLLHESEVLHLIPLWVDLIQPLVISSALLVSHAATLEDELDLLLPCDTLLLISLDAFQLADLPHLVLFSFILLIIVVHKLNIRAIIILWLGSVGIHLFLDLFDDQTLGVSLFLKLVQLLLLVCLCLLLLDKLLHQDGLTSRLGNKHGLHHDTSPGIVFLGL
mmetsp:Transcript_47337/g.85291  ORF Transcript_47337/g.85291 Transcript_47337/m.85291 type:complete len:220 (+) Transcript_47337:254-913(+)